MHASPSGWYSSSTTPSTSAAKFPWINREPNPVRVGGNTGGPFLSCHLKRSS